MRLTWLDLLLIAAIPVAAVGAGHWVGRSVHDRAEPSAIHDVRHQVPAKQEQVAQIEEQQKVVRTRLAAERSSVIEETARLGTMTEPELSDHQAKLRNRALTIAALEHEAARLLPLRDAALVTAARAVSDAKRSGDSQRSTDRLYREILGAVAAVAVAGLLIGLMVASRRARVPVNAKALTIGTAVVFLTLVVTDVAGWVVTFLFAVVVATVVSRGPRP